MVQLLNSWFPEEGYIGRIIFKTREEVSLFSVTHCKNRKKGMLIVWFPVLAKSTEKTEELKIALTINRLNFCSPLKMYT